jgi:hypothetical protein
MAQRALRAFMSLSVPVRVLWLFVALQALGMLMRFAH